MILISSEMGETLNHTRREKLQRKAKVNTTVFIFVSSYASKFIGIIQKDGKGKVSS